MSIQLSGEIKDPEMDYTYEAVMYCSIAKVRQPEGDHWINLRTGSRSLIEDPEGGYIIWNLTVPLAYLQGWVSVKSDDGKRSIDEVLPDVLIYFAKGWRRATEGSFWHGSNYPDIIEPFIDKPLDNLLMLTPEQSVVFYNKCRHKLS